MRIMKNMKRFILGAAIVFMALGTTFGQIGDIGYVLGGGVADAELVMTEYLRPLANSIGANLNSGWYTTARVHKLGGFHLNFTVSTTFVPDGAKAYDLAALGLSADDFGSDNMAATFFGERGNGPDISYSQDIPPVITVAEYSAPGGAGIGFFPSPMINAGIGLPKGFEVMGRYMPTLTIKSMNLSTGLWGVGIKHDIGQWIPFVKRVPVLDFTLQYGYTKLTVNQGLSVNAASMGISNDQSGNAWDNQDFGLVTQGHTANFLVGATLPVVSFYGGVGISITQTNLKLSGDYPVPSVTTSPPIEPVVTSAITDPIDIEIKNQDGGILNPRFNAGIQFKFAIITLHFDYTYAYYSVASAGLGISFR